MLTAPNAAPRMKLKPMARTGRRQAEMALLSFGCRSAMRTRNGTGTPASLIR